LHALHYELEQNFDLLQIPGNESACENCINSQIRRSIKLGTGCSLYPFLGASFYGIDIKSLDGRFFQLFNYRFMDLYILIIKLKKMNLLVHFFSALVNYTKMQTVMIQKNKIVENLNLRLK